jgi:penicillin-binding protein 1C
VAWKTGTSRGFRDAWTISVAGPYVAGVWLGNFDNRSNPALIGREMAAPLAFELLDTLDTTNFRDPPFLNAFGLNIKKEMVCSLSGHLPGEHCPAKKPTLFIPGKSPITTCNVHRKIYVSKANGKRVCQPTSFSVAQVAEFWPSDFLHLFRKAGVARKIPPDFDSSCSDQEKNIAGIPPQIVSPKNQVTYNLSVAATEERNMIPLRAVADADAIKLYWYAGNRYLGENAPDKALLWKAEPGDYMIRAVDNLGRSDSRKLSVRVVR